MKNIDKNLDVLWSKIVKAKAGYKCEHCGREGYLNAHHIFGRRNKSVRWEIANGCALCPACHQLSSKFSAHNAPLEFIRWLTAIRGEEFLEQLTFKAYSIKKWTRQEKIDLVKQLEECLRNEEA